MSNNIPNPSYPPVPHMAIPFDPSILPAKREPGDRAGQFGYTALWDYYGENVVQALNGLANAGYEVFAIDPIIVSGTPARYVVIYYR